MKKSIIFLGLAWAMIMAPHNAVAQSRSMAKEMQEMQQRLLQMQQRMMQGLQGLDNLQDSSGMYFHFDTTFNGGDAHFFRFTPPGDSLGGSGMEEFLRGMFDFSDPTGSAGVQTFPRDDGNLPHPDDELLPEERLRQEEQQKAADPKTPAAPGTPVKKKPRIESIRI